MVELLHLAVRTPAVVAVPRVAKMGVARRFQTVRQAVLRRQFVGQPLVLNEAVLTRQMDCLLVKLQGIGVSLIEAGDLSRHQSVLVAEGRWIVVGPLAQLLPVRRQEFAPPGLLVGGCILIERRHRQRGVVKIVEPRKQAE